MKMYNPASLKEILQEYIGDTQLNELTDNIDLLQKIVGGAEIDDEMAIFLSETFDTSKDYWLNIQKNFKGE